jgi:hypothetical protein
MTTLELLEEQGALSEIQVKRKIELIVEFFHLMEEEELYWFKRCHETWLLKGDNNTAFFIELQMEEKEGKLYFLCKMDLSQSRRMRNC